MGKRSLSVRHRWYTTLSVPLVAILSLLLLTTPLSQMRATAQRTAGRSVGQLSNTQAQTLADKSGNAESDISVVPSLFTSRQMRAIAAEAPTLDSGKPERDAIQREVEPNDSLATAQPLNTNPIRVRADSYKFPVPAGGDVDIYSFFANAGDHVFANTMTSFSSGSTDTVLDVLDSAGTLLETDDEDGGFSGSSSNIAGLLLPTTGRYYVRVSPFATTQAGTIRSYDLYVRVVSGAPAVEVEPNNNGNTPNPLPANGYVTGIINPAADSDTYSLTAEAGDTIVAVMDVDPERDAPEWDGRLGIGLFDNNFLVVNSSAVGGTFDDANPSEAIMFTVNQTGTYVIYVDNPVGSGAANFTYSLAVSVIKPNTKKCTLYTGGTTGAVTDAGTTNFTLNIPDSRIIGSMQVLNTITASTTSRADLDVSLIAPDGNEVVLYDDPSSSGTATAPQIDFRLDDEASNIVSGFGINKPIQWTPEPLAKLDLFKGEQAQGTWTLRVRDDLANSSVITVDSWSLNICEDPNLRSVPQTSIYSQDFEAGTGGFTHSGTLDEWELGLPSLAPITTCHSGTNCWKTDLDGIYQASSNQDLLSPPIDLTTLGGRYITAQWWQKYQMDTASNDTAYVEVREVGNPTNFRRLWEWKGALMTRGVGVGSPVINLSAGWGQMQSDISDFGGKMVELRFHLESGTGTTNFSGLAIDDVDVSYGLNAFRADFDNDAKTDISVWRPSNGNWFIRNSATNTLTFVNDWGRSALGDIAVPGHYGGGGADVAVWRPSEGNWYSLLNNTTPSVTNWGGVSGDIPVTGDFNGDGTSDFTIFRPSEGNWYTKLNGPGTTSVRGWGAMGDKPVPADYDGDGTDDIAVFRPSEGNWYIIDSFTGVPRVVNFGTASDKLVPADYDGDRKADIAIWRPSEGNWYILRSSDGRLTITNWGVTGDIPVPGKYDADTKYDIAVFRPSEGNWYGIRSTDNTVFLNFLGQPGDVPAPSAYLPQ
jgi:subtilisin-like proprotein convertase family protein